MPLLSKSILLRVSESEKNKITAQAKQANLSVNDFLRSRSLGLPTQDEVQLKARLARIEERLDALEDQ